MQTGENPAARSMPQAICQPLRPDWPAPNITANMRLHRFQQKKRPAIHVTDRAHVLVALARINGRGLAEQGIKRAIDPFNIEQADRKRLIDFRTQPAHTK
jgi:hypothetical protein